MANQTPAYQTPRPEFQKPAYTAPKPPGPYTYFTNYQGQPTGPQSYAGNTYSSNFTGPIRPQDRYAGPNFIGPTLSGPSPTAPGQVLGAATTVNTPPPANNAPPGGGGGGGGGGGPTGQSEDDIRRQIDEAYNPAMGYLNETEGQFKNALSGAIDQAGSAYGSAVGTLQGQYNTGTEQINAQQNEAGMRRENALAASRRLYDELRKGWQARFGGASSAGEAAYELGSNEQQRSQGGTMQEYERTMGSLTQSRNELERNYNNGLLKLKEFKDTAIASAQQFFANKLQEINSNRAMLESQKGQQRLLALQELRNNIFKINSDTSNFQKELDQQKQLQALELDDYIKKAGIQAAAAGQDMAAFRQNVSLNPQSGLLSLNGYNSNQGAQQPAMAGQAYPIATMPDGRKRYSDGSIS